VKPGRKSSEFIYDEAELDKVLEETIAKRKKEGSKVNPDDERVKQAGFLRAKALQGFG
jgi:hypothetical protein